MLRLVIGALGVVTVLIPDRILTVFEAAAIENPEECTPRSSINPALRAEGVLIALAGLIGGRAYAAMMNITGLAGLVILLSPNSYRKIATTLLYENPDDVEWNDQFTGAVRIIGLFYILMAAWAFNKRRDQ